MASSPFHRRSPPERAPFSADWQPHPRRLVPLPDRGLARRDIPRGRPPGLVHATSPRPSLGLVCGGRLCSPSFAATLPAAIRPSSSARRPRDHPRASSAAAAPAPPPPAASSAATPPTVVRPASSRAATTPAAVPRPRPRRRPRPPSPALRGLVSGDAPAAVPPPRRGRLLPPLSGVVAGGTPRPLAGAAPPAASSGSRGEKLCSWLSRARARNGTGGRA